MAETNQSDATIKQGIDIPLRVNKRFVSKMPKNTTTPNVKDLEYIVTNNAIATNWSNFLNGRDGQPLNILANDANTTLVNNANIVTNTGANKLLTQGKVYRLHFFKVTGKWHEDA